LRRAPELVLSDRVQHMYPSMVTSIAERMFRVDNPAAKPGLRRIFREERKAAGAHLRDLISDGRSAFRTFG
jgi:electron transfer flavoprotein-quinone oxidoreductase